MKSYDTMKLTNKRNAPNFYKSGRELGENGFVPGTRFRAWINPERNMVVLRIDAAGDRIVSLKNQSVPVIDINTREVLGRFVGMDRVRVVVLPGEVLIMALASEERRLERLNRLKTRLQNGDAIRMGSFCHGAGVMSHALHTGMNDAGMKTDLAFANDIEPVYLNQAYDHNDAWNSETTRINAPMQELVYDSWAMQQIGLIEGTEAGIPCNAASPAGRAKKHSQGHTKPEDDRDSGHIVMSLVAAAVALNVVYQVVENSNTFITTAGWAMYRSQMADLGYDVHAKVVESHTFGTIEKRKRMVAVAMTRGIPFDLDGLVGVESSARTVADILDPVPLDDPAWSRMDYLKRKEVNDQMKKAAGLPGTWFARQEVHASDSHVPTVTKGYIRRRSTDPMLLHPENPELLRLFTPAEAARLKDIPVHLVADMVRTRALEALGQSVGYPLFRALGVLIAEKLQQWASAQIKEDVEPMFELRAA